MSTEERHGDHERGPEGIGVGEGRRGGIGAIGILVSVMFFGECIWILKGVGGEKGIYKVMITVIGNGVVQGCCEEEGTMGEVQASRIRGE